MLRSERPLPLWTLFAFVFLNDSYIVVDDPWTRAALRLVFSVVLIGWILLAPTPKQRTGENGGQVISTAGVVPDSEPAGSVVES
jgi:hypothetical protein